MKISIGAKLFDGPWGGGNLFVKNLSEYLISRNHKVVYNLFDDDIDVILLTDPRKSSYTSNFSHVDIFNYIKYINQDCLIVHRINECDERKNTNGLNNFLVQANKSADRTVFVSTWLRDLFENIGLQNNNSVIMTGADKKIFNPEGKSEWRNQEKLKFVTHHWGNNWKKGFDIYSKFDELLELEKYRDKVEFTFIGNLPKDFIFKNTKHIEPTHGNELANLLRQNHVYLTASEDEPSGNHHIEGAQCGLPILYLDSGGIPEFCNEYGLMFQKNNFEAKLDEIIKKYNFYDKKMSSYPFDSDKMSQEYLNLFIDMHKKREIIIKGRAKIPEKIIDSRISYKYKRKLNILINRYPVLFLTVAFMNRINLKLKSIILN